MSADQARARRTSSCRCVKLDDNSTGGPIAIQSSVGRGGVNRPDDVRTIQDALNRLGPHRSGPVPPLDVDGFIGPKTIGAIEKFQREQCGFAWPDGRVDPGQKTITRLNELLGTGPMAGKASSSPSVPGIELGKLVAYMVKMMPRVEQCVRNAEKHLQMARPYISRPNTDVERQLRMGRINRHFKLDQLFNRVQELEWLIGVYGLMRTVLQPVTLWGAQTIQPDPFPDAISHEELDAYTYVGGYYRGAEKNRLGQRLDAIYLTEQMSGKTDDEFILVLIHELAHFVGHRSGPRLIDDFDIYGWVDSPEMALLRPEQRVRHADTFANFAFDVKFGRRPQTIGGSKPG